MFIYSTIKCEFIKQLDHITLRRLPSQHGEDSVMELKLYDSWHLSKIPIFLICKKLNLIFSDL